MIELSIGFSMWLLIRFWQEAGFIKALQTWMKCMYYIISTMMLLTASIVMLLFTVDFCRMILQA